MKNNDPTLLSSGPNNIMPASSSLAPGAADELEFIDFSKLIIERHDREGDFMLRFDADCEGGGEHSSVCLAEIPKTTLRDIRLNASKHTDR